MTNTERDGSVLHSAFMIQRLGESGRACSSPRQWKHGHERARLTPKTERILGRLQKSHAEIWKRHPVSSPALLQAAAPEQGEAR